jgi:hypothetical protein
MKLPAAEFAPDQPTLTEFIDSILNALPLSQRSYGPVGTLGEVGNALEDRCQGAWSGQGTDGTIVNFAYDDNKAYLWNGTSWNDVTTSGAVYSCAPDGFWTTTQFGNEVLLQNGIDAMQTWTIGTSTKFDVRSASSGSVPVATYGAVIKDFFVVANVASAQNRVQWPDINTTDEWAAGQASSQDLPTGGPITGLVGGEYGTIFSGTAIRAMTYIGTPDIFQFDVISVERGCDTPGSIAAYQGSIFFHAPDGFWLLQGGSSPVPIGTKKVDNWFNARIDRSNLDRVKSIVDPVSKRYYIAYPTLEDGSGRNVELLVYDFSVQRWALVVVSIDILFAARTTLSTTLEGLDAIYPDLDTMPLSLDSSEFQGSQEQTLAVFTQNKKMAFFGSSPMTAYIDTVEGEPYGPLQSFLQGLRPMCEGNMPTLSASVGTRQRLNDPIIYGDYVTQNAQGRIPFRRQGRYVKARFKLEGQWTEFSGCDVEAKQGPRR